MAKSPPVFPDPGGIAEVCELAADMKIRSGTPLGCFGNFGVTGGVVASLLNHRLFSVTPSESEEMHALARFEVAQLSELASV